MALPFPIPNLNLHGGQSGAQGGRQDFGGVVNFAPIDYQRGIPTAFVIAGLLVGGYFVFKGQ